MYRDRQSWYDIMQVCVNGHQITSTLKSHPNDDKKHCPSCGAITISNCQKCDADIQGYYHTPGVAILAGTPIPEFCHECGAPYPWKDLKKNSERTQINFDINIERLFLKLPLVIEQIQKRYDNRSTLNVRDEYDLQDLLHVILRLYFDDIRSEEYTPSYAGTTSRMDFMLPDKGIVIETKMTRASLNKRKLSKELILDKEYYQKSNDCKILYCLVYDPIKIIDNPKGFEKDISENNTDFTCKVIIIP